MNASLRRISVTVMALIVLLLLNATMTQVFTADGLRADPRNQRVLLDEYSRQRGQITAGGQLLAYSVATDGRFRFLRVYPNPEVYAPVTGFYSLRYSSTALERAEDPILNGSDRRLFGRRLADFFTGRDHAAVMSIPRSTRAFSKPAGTRCSKAATGPVRERWSPLSHQPARFWRWCLLRPTTPTCWRRITPRCRRKPGSGLATIPPLH